MCKVQIRSIVRVVVHRSLVQPRLAWPSSHNPSHKQPLTTCLTASVLINCAGEGITDRLCQGQHRRSKCCPPGRRFEEGGLHPCLHRSRFGEHGKPT